MPFNPTSPIRGYLRAKHEMPSPSRAISRPGTTDTPLTGTALTSTGTDAPSRAMELSNYTSNTGGRARQNWRNSISSAVGSLRQSNATLNPARLDPISAAIRRVSADTTNESPTDPSLIPSGITVAVELPASPNAAEGPIAKPDEPRSFLDLDSDGSSKEGAPYSQPIISRANSIRVQRPKLIQKLSGDHSSHAASEITIDVYNGDLLEPRSAPVDNVARPMSTHEEDDEEPSIPKTPATETTVSSTRGMGPQHAYRALTANAPCPQFVSRFSATTVESPLPTHIDSPVSIPLSKVETVDNTAGLGPAAAMKALTGEDDNASTNAAESQDAASITLLPPQESDSTVMESIMEAPNTSVMQSTLSSPIGGFGAIFTGAVERKPNRFTPFSLNSVDADAARLHRTISAPPLPHKNLNRKVTIKPSDLVIADSRGGHRLFRDKVVSTPYPTRNGSIANPEEALAEKKGLTRFSEQQDRFPSPSRAEVLVLQLAAARHAGLKKTAAIEVADKGTFDDEQLFKGIRKAYSSDLLGSARRVFSARQLSHATFSKDLSFDAEDFIKHMKDPKTGHKRKGWLLWLRQHQPVVSDSPQVRSRDSHVSYYSPSSIPRMPFRRILPLPPKVVLHFEFSIRAIALAVLFCLLLSCLATVLWVLFGVPGFDARSPVSSVGLVERNWRLDAEGRVLTGLVLGILVLSLSSLGSAVWIGGSYVLL